MSVDVQLLRIRDDSGKLPIHVACQTSTPLDCLAALVNRDAATLQMTDHAGALPLHEYCSRCDMTRDWGSALRLLVERGGIGTLAVASTCFVGHQYLNQHQQKRQQAVASTCFVGHP